MNVDPSDEDVLKLIDFLLEGPKCNNPKKDFWDILVSEVLKDRPEYAPLLQTLPEPF